MNEWHTQVAEWRDFYALVGTAGATLMGLTFVVISLSPRTIMDREDAVRSSTTPIMAFFTTVVFVAVLMLVPRVAPFLRGLMFVVIALIGLVYMCTTGTYQSWRQSDLGYDDLLWYVLWPFVAYIALLVGGIEVWRNQGIGMYIGAASVVFFLLIGVRNAWDVVLAVARISAGRDPTGKELAKEEAADKTP
ncbi:MAG: hypothetical protein JO165_08505 [Candidatus Eremiobacteraeota bacterium]|nr:hypothetical protein [Candidatus Eremiobacteraeota bacterium]